MVIIIIYCSNAFTLSIAYVLQVVWLHSVSRIFHIKLNWIELVNYWLLLILIFWTVYIVWSTTFFSYICCICSTTWFSVFAMCYRRRSIVCYCQPSTWEQSTCRRSVCSITHNISPKAENSFISAILPRHLRRNSGPWNYFYLGHYK